MATEKVILVTGASSGFGAMMVRALADAKHIVYAGMRDIDGRNAESSQSARAYADEHGVDTSARRTGCLRPGLGRRRGRRRCSTETGRLDVVVHNAGHMVLGPAEAFTPEQVASVYDTNVLSTQRVNRAVLPHMRARRDGLVIWIGFVEHPGRHTALPRAVLRGQGGGGCTRSQLRPRAHPVRHRDHDRRARLVHLRHEPLRQRRPSRRHRRRGGL